MASNSKNRQKKLARKKKKRKLRVKSLNVANNIGISKNASNYAQFPIHECLIPDNLFEIGIGHVTIVRRLSNGLLAVSGFIVDVHCLGVKNALFHVMNKYEYENNFKASMFDSHEGIFESIHPTCAKKIITGAVLYAKELGFKPDRDYSKSKGIFGDIDSNACPEKIEFGKYGKPFYVRGPNESVSQAKKIVETLAKKCGEGNFDYMIMLDDPTI